MWTHFWDMHSGGSQKLDWAHIYIEAPEDEAKIIFYNRFDRSPERVTCTCCGSDYSISEFINLAQATGFERGCAGNPNKAEWPLGIHYIEELAKDGWRAKKSLLTVEEYGTQKNVLYIPADLIQDHERTGTLPEEGYVWAGG